MALGLESGIVILPKMARYHGTRAVRGVSLALLRV